MTNDDDWRRAEQYLENAGDFTTGYCHDDIHAVADMLSCVRDEAFAAGLVWSAAIVAMFEAIRENAPRRVERSYWTSEIDGAKLYDCTCPGCGVRMKGRSAGVDEGTLSEWCGSCRY